MNCEMLDVKLKVDSPMMADYLAYLFPPDSPGGPLKVYAGNSIGRLLVAHCKVAEGPVALEGDKVVDLELPSDIATAPLASRKDRERERADDEPYRRIRPFQPEKTVGETEKITFDKSTKSV